MRDRADAEVRAYFERRLREIGWKGESLSLRTAMEFAVEAPTPERIRVVGALVAWVRLAARPSADLELSCALDDFYGILRSERDAVARKEMKHERTLNTR